MIKSEDLRLEKAKSRNAYDSEHRQQENTVLKHAEQKAVVGSREAFRSKVLTLSTSYRVPGQQMQRNQTGIMVRTMDPALHRWLAITWHHNQIGEFDSYKSQKGREHWAAPCLARDLH